MAEENPKQFKDEIIKHFDEKTEETQRHFDVVAEDLKSQIQKISRDEFAILERRVSMIEAKQR